MAGPVRISILANGSQSVREFSRVGSAASGTSSKIAKYSKVAAAGLLAVGAVAVKVGIDSVKMASDQEEALNKSNVIFGKSAGAVERWADGMAKSFGISKAEALANASTFGDMFSQIGFGTKQTRKLSTGVVELAADLGSFHNLPTSDVLDSISGAMRGEYDSIQRLVPALNAARVEQVAMATTGKDNADQLTAQEKAAATLKIVYGDTSAAQGDFARTSDSLANRSKRLEASLDDVQARIGRALLPLVLDAAEAFETHLLPQIERGSRYLEDHADEISKAADKWGGDFLEALETAWSILKPVLDTVSEIPAPVHQMGVEVAFAATAFSKLKLFGLIGALNGYSSAAGTATTKTQRLAGMARQAAGVGGLLAIAHGFKTAAEEGRGFKSAAEKAAGAIAVGFAVGGPGGAGVGAIAGVTLAFKDLESGFYDLLGVENPAVETARQLAEQQDAAAAAADRHTAALEGLTATLEGGRNTAASLEPAYANLEGELGAMGYTAETLNRQWRIMGVSQRTLAQASLGNQAAIRRVNKAYQDTPLEKRIVNEHQLEDAISNTTVRNRLAMKEERARLRLTQEWGGKLKSFPKEARTAIKLDGVTPSIRGIAKVVDKYDLTPKEIKTLLEVTGVDGTVKEVREVQRNLDDTGKRKPRPEIVLFGAQSVNADINTVTSGLIDLNGNAAHTYIYTHRITTYEQRGNAPGAGRLLAEEGRAIGKAIGETLTRTVAKAGAGVGYAFLQSVIQGSSGVETALGRATAFLERKIKLDDDKKERAREKAVLKHLKDEYAALKRVGAAIDDQKRKLGDARQRLEELRAAAKAYAEQVKQSIVDSGSIADLGKLESGEVSITGLLDQLRDKVARAQRYAALIRQLTEQGLNQTSLQQLLAAGPDAGLAAAEAIAAGGAGAISEINALTGDLIDAGQSLGADMADTFFAGQIADASDTIDALMGDLNQLRREAERRARILARAMRRALRGNGGGGGGGGGGNGRALAIPLTADDLTPSRRRRDVTEVNLTFVVPPTANKAEIGREVASALKAFYADGGARV